MDLDETALNSNSRLDERTRAAIHAVHNSGYPIIIATSRPERVLPTLVGNDILEITSLVQMNGTIATGRAELTGDLRVTMNLDDARMCWSLFSEMYLELRMSLDL